MVEKKKPPPALCAWGLSRSRAAYFVNSSDHPQSCPFPLATVSVAATAKPLPSKNVAVFVVSEHVETVTVHVTAVATPFFTTVKVRFAPAPSSILLQDTRRFLTPLEADAGIGT